MESVIPVVQDRQFGMLHSQTLTIESALSAAVARERVLAIAGSRLALDAPAARRQQVLGWRLLEQGEEFVLQPECADTLSFHATRFVGRVEADGSGSRISGRVMLSSRTRFVMDAWMIIVTIAAMMALVQDHQPVGHVLLTAGTMLVAGVLMLRFAVQSAVSVLEPVLRAALDANRQTALRASYA